MGQRILIGLLAAVMAVPLLYAANPSDPPEAVSLFARGKRYLREGDWHRAAKAFEELAGRYPHSENLDQFVFCRAKAEYYSGEYSEAVAGFTYFLSRFGDSPELAHAYFFLGNSYYRLGDVDQAAKSYFDCYRQADDPLVRDLAAGSIAAAVRNTSHVSLGRPDFEAVPEDRRCSLIKLVADVLSERGESSAAEDLLSLCDEGFERTSVSGQPSKHSDGKIEIAMVLPLSGELHSFGQDIYDGAVVAAEIHRNQTSSRLTLVPYDTKGIPVNAARIVGGLSELQTVAAVGPLTSEEAAVASASLSCKTLPLLVPAATQAGLTRLSKTSFQLSPNIELQGVKMAEYAIDILQADSAAVITSTDAEHLLMAEAFADRFQQLGGIVVAVEYYRRRDRDFGPYIRDIKAILLGAHPDSTFFINDDGDTLDPDGLPAHIDCLFLPGDPDQIRLLLPQIKFYVLNGSFLGSDGWGDEAVLKLGDDVTREAVFPSPFLPGPGSDEYAVFSAAYDARFGRRPSRLAALGYDAARLVIGALRSGRESKRTLVEQLERVQGYEGASGVITFGDSRENIEMPLFRILSEQAIPLLPSADSVTDEGGQ